MMSSRCRLEGHMVSEGAHPSRHWHGSGTLTDCLHDDLPNMNGTHSNNAEVPCRQQVPLLDTDHEAALETTQSSSTGCYAKHIQPPTSLQKALLTSPQPLANRMMFLQWHQLRRLHVGSGDTVVDTFNCVPQ